MLALRSGLKCVHGVEMSPVMFDICQQTVLGNECSEAVSLHCLKSTDMNIPEHMPHRASLVVTEIMDCALLGEHIVPTLRHAWQHLLLPPPPSAAAATASPSPSPSSVGGDVPVVTSAHGQVIPQCAAVYASPVECPSIRLRSRLVHDGVMSLDSRGLCWVGSDHVDNSTDHHTGDTTTTTTTTTAASSSGGGAGAARQSLLAGRDAVRSAEPYSIEHLSQVRGSCCPLQATPSQILTVNFNDPLVPVCIAGDQIEVAVEKCGMLDSVAVYFDASLSAGNVISTNPFVASSTAHCAWQPATYPLTQDKIIRPKCWQSRTMGLCNDCSSLSHSANCIRVCAGDRIVLSVKSLEEDTRLHIDLVDVIRARLIAGSRATGACETAASDHFQKLSPVFIERCQIARLNDRSYCTALDTVCKAIALKCGAPFRMLDLSHGVPICGVNSLHHAQNASSSAVLLNTDTATRDAVLHLARHNSVPGSVTFASLADAYTLEYDVVIADLVSPLGFLYTDSLEQYAAARRCLRPNATACPTQLELWAMCVDSAAMRAQTAVLGNRPTLGIDVARHINRYQVGTLLGVDMTTLDYTQLTEPVRLLQVDLDHVPEYPFSAQTNAATVKVQSTGNLTAVVYWFRSHLIDDVIVDSSPLLCQSVESHWLHSAVMLPDDVSVSTGSDVQLLATLQDGCVGIQARTL